MIMTSGNLPMDAALPTRADVERRWVSLIQGGITRDEVHAWAARWVETGGLGQIPDLMIRNALQHLHGYDLTRDPENPEVLRHDSNGIHVRTDGEIAEEIEEWRSNCLAYDRDPQGYVQSARNRGRDALQGLECDPDAGLAESISGVQPQKQKQSRPQNRQPQKREPGLTTWLTRPGWLS
jgi:hypothetical protein